MGLIHVLDTEVSNKIAAGEVVERPLSIVKELVENSIDAGASAITIEIRGGGVNYIRVTDNGSGMSAEDAKICFLRHATSKIARSSDLEAIYTLGFRGEALSSIGAVAKVRLYTKRVVDGVGVCVTCEGGEILSSADAGVPNGTVMEVTDLFYNTPARLKFLKKAATEAGYISDIVSRYVFAHPEISFKLIRDGKEVIFSAGDNKLINAVYAVYGRDYAKNLLEVNYDFNGIHVSGVIGKGTLGRANRNYESFFVNRRYIKSAIMIRALEEAYKNQIMISKFPTAILNVELDAGLVDINVHPTKLECKFSNEHDIYQAVYHAAHAALYAMPNVPEIERRERPSTEFKFKTEHRETPKAMPEPKSVPEPEKAEETPVRRPAMTEQPKAAADDNEAASYSALLQRARAAEQTRPAMRPAAEEPVIRPAAAEPAVSAPPKERTNDPFALLDKALEKAKRRGSDKGRQTMLVKDPGFMPEQESIPELKPNAAADENAFSEGSFRVIGQLFETYILIEKGDRLLMIDQHAAHERLNYEELKRELEQSGVTSQMILEPVEIRLSGEDYAVYCENRELFGELGFECASEAEGIVLISAVPGDIGWSETEPLFSELLTGMRDMKQTLITERKERLLYTISCKAAIKANMAISMVEMQKLAEKVFRLKNINTCPHGRPIVISMSKKEIEKDFKRIV